MPRTSNFSKPHKFLQKKVPLDQSILEKSKIKNKKKIVQTPKEYSVTYNLSCPLLFFIKVVFLKDAQAINYLKYRIKLAVRNSKQRSADYEKTHKVYLQNDLTLSFVYNLLAKQNFRCAISNIPIMFAGDEFPQHMRASIDRIDNNLGYTKDNIQLVSLPINHAKGKSNDSEVLNLIKLIKLF